MVPLLSGILVTLFGGLTIYFKNPIFIYMKPTIINILFALALFFGKYFTNEPMLKKILGKSLPLRDEGWKILNNRWMYFFFGLAILNELVWRTQTEEFWVNFKVWGMLPITFIFTAFQIGFILFIPFLVIDLVVSSILLSMGMMMLPPVMVSLPFKILLFVLVDGGNLVVQSLVESFN